MVKKIKKLERKPGKLKKLDISQLKKVTGGYEEPEREPRYCPGGKEKVCRDFELAPE
jgi:hypothetical protein